MIFLCPVAICAQARKITGIYQGIVPAVEITFNADSSFQYISHQQHPTFYRYENFSEKGRWTVSGDTIILNPGLEKKVFVAADFTEQEDPADSNVLLTFNHVKRYFDSDGNIQKEDTVQIRQLDFAFNEWRKRKLTRVAPARSSRCTFAGYIPAEIITSNRTITVPAPVQPVQRILIGCYELQGTRSFIVKNTHANHFCFTVYSNYYLDGQIRQMKFLVKNEHVIYTRQKDDGQFEKDNIWSGTEARLIKKKGQ